MIALREVMTDADYAAWRYVRMSVVPGERAPTVEQLRAGAAPDRLLLLAVLDGEVVGSGVVAPSDLSGRASVIPRVLPHARRRGVGGALLYGLAAHGTECGFPAAVAHASEAAGVAFGARFGFVEVDRQVEQVRAIGAEPMPQAPRGVRIVSVAEQPHRWREAYESIGKQAFADMPVMSPLAVRLADWEREWIGDPAATFLAVTSGNGGAPGGEVVGCAGLLRDGDRPDRAEHGLTAVRRDWRGRGVAAALKRRTLAWAAANGIREVYTWTQRGNEDMRRLNERLGFTYGAQSVTLQAPLPL